MRCGRTWVTLLTDVAYHLPPRWVAIPLLSNRIGDLPKRFCAAPLNLAEKLSVNHEMASSLVKISLKRPLGSGNGC
jgi:hypothetical protein